MEDERDKFWREIGSIPPHFGTEFAEDGEKVGLRCVVMLRCCDDARDVDGMSLINLNCP